MISLVMPAYNEAAAVAATIEEMREVLSTAGYRGFEIILVDDGSTDGTATIAAQAGAVVVRNLQNLGYGRSLKHGIAAAKNEIVVIADADNTYPATAIPGMVALHKQGIHMVVGERTGQYIRERPIKRPLRFALKWLVEFTTGNRIPDANSGLRVFARSDIMPFFDQLSDKYSFTTSVTLAYMLNKKYVAYVPVEYKKRLGHTTVSVLRDTLQTFQYIVQTILYFNPIKIFLATALFVGLASVLALVTSIALGFVPGVWIGSGGMLLAVLVFVLGLLAEQLRQILHEQRRQRTGV